ncbi:MAG: diacylglycerol kinase family lipid kinase [Marinoscillum sp.]|uniref:diacylglycerol/lipid kinase family protein n=2 Tax=Marinoscillum sp. TaxID=2024838 RepID=UPI0032FC83DE
MKKHLFVINPVSGSGNADELLREIAEHFSTPHTPFQILQTTGSNDMATIKGVLDSYGPDIVVVAGGDGTINMVAPLLLSTGIPLGIIPSGSANGLAREFGISMNNALQNILHQHTSLLDVVLINDRYFMLHMADLGLNASLVRRYEEENRSGFMGYAISALQELPTLDRHFEVTITSENSEKHFETNFLVIANTRMYGTGYEINPTGQFNDHQAELCVMKPLSAELIINNLFLQNQPDKNSDLFEIHSYQEVKIKANTPVDFQSDGEYIGELTDLHIRVLPDQLKIIRPDQS